jgi:hypothetical protein
MNRKLLILEFLFSHILHEEIDRTLSRDHVIQDHYKNLCHMECILCLKEEQFNTHHQVRIGRILDGQSLSSDINRVSQSNSYLSLSVFR